MRLRWEALRALRLNYTRKGVWIWLKGRKRRSGVRGWREVWLEPERVRDEQIGFAQVALAGVPSSDKSLFELQLQLLRARLGLLRARARRFMARWIL